MNTTDRNNCTRKEDGSWHSNLGDDRTLYTREDPDTIDHILQTVLASLYDDRLISTWTGKEEGDDGEEGD